MRPEYRVHWHLKDTHSRVNICAGEIDDQNELKRYVLLVPESRHISPHSFVRCQYLLLGG